MSEISEKHETVPRFSVLVPCYNVERYIEACVSSVMGQTFGDWEIVAVDDGSTDATGVILDRLKDELGQKLSVVHTVNNGQLLARREAVRHARGSYVVCLDSDDALRVDALEHIDAAIRKSPGALIQFKLCRKPDYSGDMYPCLDDVPCHVPVSISELQRSICESAAFNNLCGKAFPLRAVNARDDYSEFAHVKNGEDLLQLLPIVDACKTVVFLDEPLYYYRPNDASITRNYNPRMYRSVKTVNEVLREYAKGWNDPSLEGLLKKRWIDSILNLLRHLELSDYSLLELRSAIVDLRSDNFFEESWAASKEKIAGRGGLLMRLFAGRHLMLVAISIDISRRKLRLKNA